MAMNESIIIPMKISFAVRDLNLSIFYLPDFFCCTITSASAA